MRGKPFIQINGRKIGPDYPCYIIAEMSANHNQNFDQAVRIMHAAKDAGADAVKIQTYTPDTITIQSDRPEFRIGGGTLWDGRTLYDLYSEACTPWDWHPKLKEVADNLELVLFSTPFDNTAVDFLQEMGVPAYKVASFEFVDIPLIEHIASKGKPIIMSTGMAIMAEITEAVQAARNAGAKEIALLKCTSDYPARPEEMNLCTIPHMAQEFGVPIGLSDHTMEVTVPVVAVALGACIIEKHFTISRDLTGPDSPFSLEPQEFKAMVESIRTTEKALGEVRYEISEQEAKSRVHRRSLYIVKNMKAGEMFTQKNIRSIRPSYGLHTRYFKNIIGKRAKIAIKRGTPLNWELIY